MRSAALKQPHGSMLHAMYGLMPNPEQFAGFCLAYANFMNAVQEGTSKAIWQLFADGCTLQVRHVIISVWFICLSIAVGKEADSCKIARSFHYFCRFDDGMKA